MKNRAENSRRSILLGISMLLMVFIIAAMQSSPVYAEDDSDTGIKIKYTDQFTYTVSGVEWQCCGAIVNKDGAETYNAVVYGCDNATPEVNIPSTVRDSAGNTWPVIGVVSATTINSSYSGVHFRFNEYSENGIYNIVSLKFPDSVFLIGDRAFESGFDPDEYSYLDDPYDTSAAAFSLINTIDLPDNADLVIGSDAFAYCGEYAALGTAVTFGSKPVTVESRAFQGCSGIESLTLPAGSNIASDAFIDCLNIKEIKNAPARLDLGNFYKGEKPELTSVSFAEGLTEIYGIGLSVITNAESEEDDVEYYQYGLVDSLKNITIPSTAKLISGLDHFGIESITLPQGLQTISEGTFEGCTNLKSVNLPSSLTEIGDCAFKDCVNLQIDVVHPTQDLEYQYYNSGIRSITLRSDLMVCYPGGFTKCPNLQSITIQGSSDKKTGGFKTKDGILYIGCYDYNGNFEGWLLGKYPAGRSGGSYTVPSDVIGLDGFAFEGCKFSEIHLPATCRMELAEYMASLPEGFNGDNIIEFYPFDNMASKPVVYVIKGSSAADLYETCSKYTVKYEPGIDLTPAQPAQTVTPVQPAQTVTPTQPAQTVKVGETVKSNNNTYKVTSVKSRTVAFTKAKNTKKVVVPASIMINGVSYKVTQINAKAFTGKKIRTITIGKNVKAIKKNAFKGSKATKIILKTKLLKKAKIKGSLKGSKIKTVQIKIGKKSVNKKYVKKYKKFFTKKNAGKKVTVK